MIHIIYYYDMHILYNILVKFTMCGIHSIVSIVEVHVVDYSYYVSELRCHKYQTT